MDWLRVAAVSAWVIGAALAGAQSGSVSAGEGKAGSVSFTASGAVPMCAMNQLSLGTDEENGSFDGMSHGGTLLVLRNISPTACRVQAIPVIKFTDGTKDLGVKSVMAGSMPPHSGHGPVVLPVVVAAGAEVTSTLRWVSGEVFKDSVCAQPKALVFKIGGEMQQVAFGTRMCGERSKGIVVEMGRFTADPVYVSGK